ncbi:Zinc finger protein 576 [Acipenser ruthenus]|uniref:Zinc finger protein 576 n=1 Tax=Acipenser ruthenus TaxID=7906 RepID=A0A444U9N6_ACIRT|nr:Zinc finger protein 576 [Acipenser ruthenus]
MLPAHGAAALAARRRSVAVAARHAEPGGSGSEPVRVGAGAGLGTPRQRPSEGMEEERDPLKGEGPRTQPDALKGEVPETEGAGLLCPSLLVPAVGVPPLPAAEPSSQQQCHQCMVMFGDARAKERHMRRHHPEEYLDFLLAVSRLSCHVCALPFDSSRELIDHQRTQHPQGRPFLCPVCGDSFVQSHALINHKRRHLGQSRYAPVLCAAEPVSSSHKCPHCNFLFSDLKTKNRHMNAKHPPGCREPPHRRPPPLLYSERPSEEGEVLTVRIKEEPEDFAASPEGSAGEEAPGSEREGSEEEEEEEEEEEREREREREKERELRETRKD